MGARGIIAQDIGGTLPPEQWRILAAAGVTHALYGVPWFAFEPEPGRFHWRLIQPVREIIDAGIVPIIRLTWPLPAWAPAAWAARNQDGRTTTDRTLFYRIGGCPSMWAAAAFEHIYRAQDEIWAAFPSCQFSPPGAGGGEWTHPTSHAKPPHERYVQRSLWAFCDAAQADWALHYRAGLVDAVTPPTTPESAYLCRGFTRWYREALEVRMRQAVERTPGTPWLGLIPKPGNCPENLAAGQTLLDFVPIETRSHVIVHCLFGPGNTPDSQDYVYGLMDRWKGKIAIGVEGWQGLSRNLPKLDRTPATHLLVSVDGLTEGPGLRTLETMAALWGRPGAVERMNRWNS